MNGFPRSDTRLRERQLLLMNATDQLILDHTNTLAETLQYIVDESQSILDAHNVDILFLYPDGLRNEISAGHADIGRFVPMDRSIAGLVLAQTEPILVNDIHSQPHLRDRYYPRRDADQGSGTPRVSVIAAKLTLDDQAIGVINVEADAANRYDDSHIGFVNAMARQISVAISHAALFDEDHLWAATDSLLIAGTGDNDVIMRQVLDQILNALNSLTFLKPDTAEILFADPQDDDALVVAYSMNIADTGIRVSIGSSICGEAFRSRKPVILQQATENTYYRPIVDGMRCEMAIPITFGGSQQFPIGVLNLESSRENAFSNVGQVLAHRFSRRVGNIVAMTKIRADLDTTMQDQLMVLAADQVLNAVHRINNHIGSVRAIARDLREDLRSQADVDPADIQYRLQLIQDSAEKALEIPNELRKRIGAPQESADVNAQVQAGIDSVRIPRTIELSEDLTPGLPNLPCTALDLVIENLLLNAIEAIRQQQNPGKLRVSTSLDTRLPREPFIVITVQDNGVGMSKAQVDRLFEPRPGAHRGSGLGFGMVWVRGWIRRAQGLIEVDSRPGSGTIVSIRFQIDPQDIGQKS